MGRSVTTACALLLTLASLTLEWPALARHDAFKVIIHPQNPVSSVEREFLRDAYLKRAIRWKHGEPIRPIMLSSRYPASTRFAQQVLDRSPSQLRAYWIQEIFSGRGTPPLEADTPLSVIEQVLADVGAVGVVPAEVDAGAARVIEIH